MSEDRTDLTLLIRGDKRAWDRFVVRYAGLIAAAVRRVIAGTGGAPSPGDIDDVAQDVFVRLCKDDFRLLRNFDPERASLSTWLTIVARSAAHDSLRRRRAATQTLDDTPESALAVEPVIHDRITIPDGLLSPRQSLVLTMLYQRDMEVAEIATALGVDAQTVRSTHHKAMVKLRAHFDPKP